MTTESERKAFPSLRCFMGDWAYFVTTLTFSDVARRIKRTEEVHKNKSLSDMIQRELGRRAKDIATYLRDQPERFFNAIVVGVYKGAPDWYPLNVLESRALEPPNLDERVAISFGILEMSGEERLFAIDGQHRVEGIKQALKDNPELENEELTCIFVAHHDTVEGMERTRRLFTTLNKTAVKVTDSEIIALDEDDAFAITTRRLVEDYEALSQTVDTDSGRLALIYFGRTQIPRSNDYSITTILTLFVLVKTLALPIKAGKQRKEWRRKRPSDDTLNMIYTGQVKFWEAIRRYIPEMSEVMGSDPTMRLAAKYRTDDGGHILFRPAGLQAFARAARILMDREISLDESVRMLSQTVLQLDQHPWPGVLWDSIRNRMIVRNRQLAQNLFLFMVGHSSYPPSYDLLGKYRTTIGDEEATLDEIRP